MTSINLTVKQVGGVVYENCQPVGERLDWTVLCFDDQVKLKRGLPYLYFPGGVLGFLTQLFSTANSYGFSVDYQKSMKVLIDFFGKKWYSNKLEDKKLIQKKIKKNNCFYFQLLSKNPQLFHINEKDLDFINQQLNSFLPSDNNQLKDNTTIIGVLIISGNYTVYPYFIQQTDVGEKRLKLLIYQQNQVNQVLKEFSQKLIKDKAVTLYPGCDEEYLYQVFLEESENHFFESFKNIATGLPIFKIDFKKDGRFKIEDLGKV